MSVFHKRESYQLAFLALNLTVIIFSASIANAATTLTDGFIQNNAPPKHNLALENHLTQVLQRVKRQDSPGGSDGSNPSSKQGASSAGQGNDGSTANSQNAGAEDKPDEEVLPSLKCDFGSSDVPDLCKFRILDAGKSSPLIKGLTNWSHGSGKLALYQGGPLIDASQGNDTSGGYIFYETSNPYSANQSVSQTAPNDQISSSIAFMKIPGNTNNNNNYQQLSSARLSIAGNLPGASFISPNLTAPGPAGMCLSFQYAIQGLSADELRVYVNDHKTERSRLIWSSYESAASNWTRGEILYSVTNKHSLVFSASGSSSSNPLAGKGDLQQRGKFRGYVALDEIEVNKHDPAGSEGACRGHCNFDGDLCGWTNAESGEEDDFDWTFGRGSDNLFTGPARDYISSTNNELTGSYVFTDSGYPRRPGDRAMLISPMFQPTAVNEAMCMRFAVHMFGSGVGSLVIKIRYADETAASPAASPTGSATAGGQPGAAQPAQPATSSSGKTSGGNDLVIWEMSGDAGNSWHQAQTSVSSSKSPFQVLIEGVIGENHLGNIAIDEISFSSGPCPTSPPVASKNYGDCTFEQSMCYWRNPDAEIHLDDLDWIRSADETSIHGPNFDHTLKKKSGSFLKLENTFREPKSGTRAFLLSPIFQPKTQGSVQCLSFYYYMFMRSISSSGPNLGTIRVYLASNNELVPIWRLTNPISSPSWKHGRASLSATMVDGQPVAPTKLFQIAFEGIWGDAQSGAIALDDVTVFDGACDIMPAEAKSVPGECTFDVDLCSWMNKTSSVEDISGATLQDSAADNTRSPFLQSVNNAVGHSPARSNSVANKQIAQHRMSWQLATVDSRPVNLQDHTYKAPIGYTYVDVLDSSARRMKFTLQSSEFSVPISGQQVMRCLSFWFASYGRQENNQLSLYMTQASAPPPPPEDSGSMSPSAGAATSASGTQGGGQQTGANQSGGSNSQNSAQSSPSSAAGSAGSASGADNDAEANLWKMFDGKLLWSISMKNITESNRRKWLYAQVALKVDSNYIVRFFAFTNDGGFALDDINFYEGACETRPAVAKVQSDDDAEPASPPVAPKTS